MGRNKVIGYVNGVSPATARKIAQYAFRNFYFKLVENVTEHTYDIFLKDAINGNEVNKDKIKDFRNFWGAQWKIYIFKQEAV